MSTAFQCRTQVLRKWAEEAVTSPFSVFHQFPYKSFLPSRLHLAPGITKSGALSASMPSCWRQTYRRGTPMLISVAGWFCSMYVAASIFFCAGFAKKVARMCHLPSKCLPAYVPVCLLSLSRVTIQKSQIKYFWSLCLESLVKFLDTWQFLLELWLCLIKC
jgi:hypothetical protein